MYKATFWCWDTCVTPSFGFSAPTDVNRPEPFVLVNPNVGLLSDKLVYCCTHILVLKGKVLVLENMVYTKFSIPHIKLPFCLFIKENWYSLRCSIKMLSHPHLFKIRPLLIPFKWGNVWFFISSGIKTTRTLRLRLT